MGVQLGAGARRGGAPAQAVFTERGGGTLILPPDLCHQDRSGSKTCPLPIPFAPGDRYELLHGGGGGSGDGVVHDATINFDAFDPIDHGAAGSPR